MPLPVISWPAAIAAIGVSGAVASVVDSVTNDNDQNNVTIGTDIKTAVVLTAATAAYIYFRKRL